jgi:dipeptidyl aminopeptidase/acylaminoacyl peptidase
VVAVGFSRRLVVLDARDGRRVRTLSTRASRYGGLAVRDGTVYFLSRGGRSITTCGHGAPPDQHVMAVPLAGGTPRRLLDAPVRWFDVSPDGRTLAVTEGRCPPAATITTYDVASGAPVGRWTGTRSDGTSGDISSLKWSPDSTSLLYVRETGSTVPWILDTRTAASLDDAHRVLIDDGSRLAGHLGATGALLGEFLTTDGEAQPWTFDPVSGARVHQLFCCGAPLGADVSGRSVLAGSGVRGSDLVRWSIGDTTPTRLARGITDAVWVEAADA